MENQVITIKDIAQKAGVSKTTISRYLNKHYEYMSVETQKKIEGIIKELKYRPNTIARSLKSKKSKLVGIVIHSLENQVLTLLVRGICDTCFENGYSTIIYNSYNDEEREMEYLQTCIDQQVDGIILSPSSTNFDYYSTVCESNIPVVMTNRYREDWKYDGVFTDHYSLVTKALTHMWDNGYTKVAFITDNSIEISTKMWRENAFLDFANQHYEVDGTKLVFHLSRICDNAQLSIQEIICQFMAMYPNEHKAIMACDANMLHKVIGGLQTLKVKIPEQLGVCGYDAWDWASLISPGITTVTQPLYETGTMASELLVKRMKENIQHESRVIKLYGQLIPRQSTVRLE